MRLRGFGAIAILVFTGYFAGSWSEIKVVVAQDAASTDTAAVNPVPSEPKRRYWKGNIHTHSFWSDGNDSVITTFSP